MGKTNTNTAKYKFTFVYPDFEYAVTTKGIDVTPGGWYSEGIAQLAAVIEKAGWEVSLLHYTKPVLKRKLLHDLKSENPDIVGFSVRTGVYRKAKEMISWAKELDRFVIVGSYHPTLWPDEVINWDGVDAICIGEGEKPIVELLESFPDQTKINKIKSLWVKSTEEESGQRKAKGGINKNPVAPLVEDLDSLPIPKFDVFKFDKLLSGQIKTATIILTRGCPFNCTYCWNNYARSLYPNLEKYVRFRSPKNCLKYIRKVLKVYPDLLTFRFQDDLWPFWDKNWFDDFSTQYLSEVHKPFECHLRADLLDKKIIKTLKKMKCFGIYFGVESGNDYIRNKVLKRNMKKEDIVNAFLTCRKYGIRTHAYNIVGIPHENMKRALDSIKLNAIIKPTDMFYFIFFPYAGTDLSNIAIENKFFDPNKPLDPNVNIEMPDFSKKQIRFASLYGRLFTRMYQIMFRFPGFLKQIFEKIIDFFWLFPYWPFAICNGVMVLYKKLLEKIKTFIKTYFFGLYLYLKR